MTEKTEYFLYGIMLTWDEYLDMRTPNTTVVDIIQGDENIDGIFGGRDGEFMIVGETVGIIDEDEEKPYRIPQLSDKEEALIQEVVKEKYGIIGEFHYYFIKK